MSLSDKDRILIPEYEGESFYWIKENDVKEFIQKLKQELKMNCLVYPQIINKLAGERLI